MHITMIKKRLENGEPCRKCAQAEELMRSRGLWHHIHEVVWALEGDLDSAGMILGRKHGVESAPFFIVADDDGSEHVYTSALVLIRERLTAPSQPAGAELLPDASAIEKAALELAQAAPVDIVRWALERFGTSCAIAFSGAEDVALIDMAARSGLGFSVFTLDTGRLHPETYEFIERVRAHYGIEIHVMCAQAERLEAFVRQKGLFSFYEDGHAECCNIRKVEPLERALSGYRAWMTGQRRDQSPETRAQVPLLQIDPRFRGQSGPLVKLNPLAHWSSHMTWSYIREHGVPHNTLHERGFVSIGCAPCTRPVLPGQHEREGRWWWEEATIKECGLHAPGKKPTAAT